MRGIASDGHLRRIVAPIFLLTIVVCPVLLFSVVIWRLLPPSIDWPRAWEIAENVSGVLQNIATVTALILGGVWTYYLFIKGRVLKPRLELSVAGKIVPIESYKYIRISVGLKNVGSSKVEITREGFGLDIFAQRHRPAVHPEDSVKYKVLGINWEKLLPFDVLTRHAWIEPGETIRDELMAEILVSDSIAYKIDFVIFAGGMRWVATSIVYPQLGDPDDSSFLRRESNE